MTEHAGSREPTGSIAPHVITGRGFVLDRDEWLAMHGEDVLEPDLAIIDPHVHQYDEPGNIHYLYEKLRTDLTSGHDIRATVYVQCRSFLRADGPEEMRPVGETEYANGVAAMAASGRYGPTRVNAGIVGQANVMLGAAVEAVLHEHVRVAGDRFKGIRHGTNFHPDIDRSLPHAGVGNVAGMMGDDAFRAGIRALHGLGLIFEAGCYFSQLGEVGDLARAFPELPIVLNHFGMPIMSGPFATRQAEVMAEWTRRIRELSACDNVVVKLGGIGLPLFGFEFYSRPVPPSSQDVATALKQFTDVCIDAFGPQRCMFESNFPVDRGAYSYLVYWNAAKRLATPHSEPDRRALVHDTAARVYSLDA